VSTVLGKVCLLSVLLALMKFNPSVYRKIDAVHPKFYRIEGHPLTPWGDYGNILQHGMTAHLGRVGGLLSLERTGPYMPPITFPGAGDVVLTVGAKASSGISLLMALGSFRDPENPRTTFWSASRILALHGRWGYMGTCRSDHRKNWPATTNRELLS
jgi:hypothetical protein